MFAGDRGSLTLFLANHSVPRVCRLRAPLMFAGLFVWVVLGGAPTAGLAQDMNLSLARLRVDANSPDRPAGCEPLSGGTSRAFCPDDAAWLRLASAYAGSVLPTSLAPARTLGWGGVEFWVDSTVTGIDGGASYVQLGTRGDDEAAREGCTGATGLGCNRFADSVLTWTRAGVRKGFPFGLELGASAGYLWNTSIWSLGLELRLAIFEGYREGAWAFLPDLAVRGLVRTLVGAEDVQMTIPAVEVVLSKPLVIAGAFRLTPMVAGQVAFVFADTESIDLTPDINAYDDCLPRAGTVSGCSLGDGSDFNNNATFPDLRSTRYRVSAGLRGQYEMVWVAATFSIDVVPPGEVVDDLPDDIDRQWTTTFGVGLDL